MLKEEESKKTYTSAGKRKFKATVLSATGKTQSLFSSQSARGEERPSSYIFLKYKQTQEDYRMKAERAELPFKIASSEEKTWATPEAGHGTGVPPEIYEMATKDYRVIAN